MPIPLAVGMAASSALSGLSGILGNAQRNRQNIRFWRMQNEYNHPKAQMQRLQEAGLNPRLIYGSGASSSTGNASQPPASQAENVDFKLMENMLAHQDIKMKKAQRDNLQVQSTVMQEDAELKRSMTALNNVKHAGELVNNAKGREEYKAVRELLPMSVEAAKVALDRDRLKQSSEILDYNFKDATQNQRIERYNQELNLLKNQVKDKRLTAAITAIKLKKFWQKGRNPAHQQQLSSFMAELIDTHGQQFVDQVKNLMKSLESPAAVENALNTLSYTNSPAAIIGKLLGKNH